MTSPALRCDLPLVLASASPRRSSLLESRGYRFTVRPSEVDETPPAGLTPPAIAETLALRKLRVVVPSVASGVVIAADTIVVARGDLLGKPLDAADAQRMLRTLSGTTHDVITGVALGWAPRGHEIVASKTTRVTMRVLTDAEIEGYIASGEPFGKAGSYAIQETGDRFVTAIDGPFDNVVGFPLDLFERLLAALLVTMQPVRGE